MDEISVKARAKINLGLDVLGVQDDGYHKIETMMQTVDLYDDIRIIKNNSNRIVLIVSDPLLPSNEDNLAFKGARVMMETYKLKNGFTIYLDKKIPVGAGLAGGSADCAAVMRGIQRICNLSVSTEDLMLLAKPLGADIPFCLMGGTAFAKGIGQNLEQLPPLPPISVLLAKPPASLMSGEIYRLLDEKADYRRPDMATLIQAYRQGNLYRFGSEIYNVLESVAAEKHPIIVQLKDFLLENYAFGASMTGSGSAVYGLYENPETAIQASEKLKEQFQLQDIFVTITYNS